MMSFVLLAGALCLLTIVMLTRPLWWRRAADGTSTDASPQRRPSPPLLGGLAAGVVAVAVVGYRLVGTPSQLDAAVPSAQPPQAAASAGQVPSEEQINAMVDGLAKRLQAQPNDLRGWSMLARSYVMLHRYDDAVKAYKTASALAPADATLVADRAFAVAMVNHRKLEGEPMQLLAQALAMEPTNAKALALSGTAAFDRQDYSAAVRYWEALARSQPSDSPIAQQLQMSIAEARRLGAMQPSAAGASGAVSAEIGAVKPAQR